MLNFDIIDSLLLRDKKESKDLAEHIGISPSVISDWRSGRLKPPSIDKVVKIADYFNVSVDYLLGIETVATPQDGAINENEKGSLKMNEKARNELIALGPIFKKLVTMYHNKDDNYEIVAGVTFSTLRAWNEFDFSIPPKPEQLFELLKPIGKNDFACKRHINNYVYYSETSEELAPPINKGDTAVG